MTMTISAWLCALSFSFSLFAAEISASFSSPQLPTVLFPPYGGSAPQYTGHAAIQRPKVAKALMQVNYCACLIPRNAD